ncbi:MAG: MFS transporter, partial [Bacteroidetes bacterium]|nr:MFS transporter [Bacteroidota bacterium]
FSWFALFSMWIYSTAAVTSHIYGASDTTSELYNDGADWVTVCFAAYNGFAALVAFLLQPMAKRTSRKTVHMISLVAGGIGLASIYFIQDPKLIIVSMLGVGLAWASILSMPYAILTGSLPIHKLGVYMGIFNFFIVIPQITAASILGFMVRNLFGGQAIYALIAGGVSMIIAAALVTRVDDVDEV